METIHFKTVDPVGQELLRAAALKGFNLVWERFEAQQPQDGFLRAGLACPFGCMQGPCRIDPFGRGARNGICGLGRDEMVAASLLRLSLNGALEAGVLDGPGVDTVVATAAGKLGGAVSTADIGVAAKMLCRPSTSSAQMIRQALKLGVLTLGLDDPDAATPSADYQVGYGVLSGKGPVIGVYGGVPGDLLVQVSAAAQKAGVQIVSLGSWATAGDQVIPSACTSVEVEPLLASGRINLLLAGPATAAGIVDVATVAGVSLVRWNEDVAANKIVALAKKSGAMPTAFAADASMTGSATALRTVDALTADLKANAGNGLALMGGFDSPHQSAGWIPTEVAPALVGSGLRVAGWGDAAAWMVKAGLGEEAEKSPVRVLDPRTGVLAALKAVGAKGLKGVCFVSLGGARDVALALGLAACGVRVCAATSLPVWGSKAVMAELDSQLAGQGGSLKHFDKPAGADEVLAWFRGA